jgi:hypothetical protein
MDDGIETTELVDLLGDGFRLRDARQVADDDALGAGGSRGRRRWVCRRQASPAGERRTRFGCRLVSLREVPALEPMMTLLRFERRCETLMLLTPKFGRGLIQLKKTNSRTGRSPRPTAAFPRVKLEQAHSITAAPGLSLDTLDTLDMSSLSSTGLLGSGPWTSWTGHLSLRVRPETSGRIA